MSFVKYYYEKVPQISKRSSLKSSKVRMIQCWFVNRVWGSDRLQRKKGMSKKNVL